MKSHRSILFIVLTICFVITADAQCMMGSSGQLKHKTTHDSGLAHQELPAQASKGFAFINDDGKQEATIVILNGYQPNIIIAKKGIPLKLNFDLQEEGCTGTVVLKDFDLRATLLPDTVTAVEFTPSSSGSFTFACPMNMIEGTLVIKE
jgi:hypothetical protein